MKLYFATFQTYCAVRYGNALALQDIKQHHLLLEGNCLSQQESWNVALTYYHCLDYPSAAGTARSFCSLYCNTHTQKSSHLKQGFPNPGHCSDKTHSLSAECRSLLQPSSTGLIRMLKMLYLLSQHCSITNTISPPGQGFKYTFVYVKCFIQKSLKTG